MGRFIFLSKVAKCKGGGGKGGERWGKKGVFFNFLFHSIKMPKVNVLKVT